MTTPIRFSQTSVHGALEVLFDQQTEILRQLGELMAREQELEVLVASQTESINALGVEVTELKDSGNAMGTRLRDALGAATAAIEALTAEVAAARDGAVSPEKLAELQAASDANVAKAAEAKAASDETTAQWDAVAQPEPPAA
jgi:uncharacterized coiled-coil protein SlyX